MFSILSKKWVCFPRLPRSSLKWGLKRIAREEGVEAEQEGGRHQEDKLNDFRADGEFSKRRRTRKPGTVQDAVGEEQQTPCFTMEPVPCSPGLPFQVTVEPGVATVITRKQANSAERGPPCSPWHATPEGQRQAERGGAVLAAPSRGHGGHGPRQQRAER